MKRLILCLLTVLPALRSLSQDMVSDHFNADDFPLVSNGSGVVPIYIDPKDHWLVGKAAQSLADDSRRVTGFTPTILTDLAKVPRLPNLIIIGSLDQSSLIQRVPRAER